MTPPMMSSSAEIFGYGASEATEDEWLLENELWPWDVFKSVQRVRSQRKAETGRRRRVDDSVTDFVWLYEQFVHHWHVTLADFQYVTVRC